MRNYIIEMTGTFFLVLIVLLTGNPLAIGAGLMVLVYMGGHISGAHYNPAVTLALLIRKAIGVKEALIYMVFQIVGALLGAFMYLYLHHKTVAPTPNPNFTSSEFLIVELLFTFLLAMVVLNVATSRKTLGNSYYGLAIGFTVLAAAFAGGPISGGAFNPAVGIGPILVDTMKGGNSIGNLWIYIIGPFAGGAIAGLLYNLLDLDVREGKEME
ncbi:MAG: MIP/aquaporin family protein [Cytophagaceae bacterium]|jgi:aquaporin Z